MRKSGSRLLLPREPDWSLPHGKNQRANEHPTLHTVAYQSAESMTQDVDGPKPQHAANGEQQNSKPANGVAVDGRCHTYREEVSMKKLLVAGALVA
jgi:hypothetical protein